MTLSLRAKFVLLVLPLAAPPALTLATALAFGRLSGAAGWAFGALLAGYVALACAILVLLSRKVLRPVMRVEAAAARIAAGDLGTRVGASDRDDETGRLARTFDAMAAQLQRNMLERERDEARLRESEARLAEAQRIAHIGSWEADLLRPGNDRWSDEMYRIVGLAPGATPMSYAKFLDFVHREDRHLFAPPAAEGAAGLPPERIDIECRIVRSDGQVRWLHLLGVLEADASRGVLRLAGTGQDVTERKSAEARLRDSEARFRQVTETIDEMFWLADLDPPRCLYASPAYATLFGRPADELLTNMWAWMDAVHPEDLAAVQAFVQGRSGVTEMEYRIVRSDGAVRWVRNRVFLVPNGDGKPHRMAGLTRDITRRKEAELALHAAKARLEELDRFRTQFVNNAVHELKNPLSPIKLELFLLRDRLGPLNERQRHAVDIAARNADALQRLVQDVLEAARLQAGKLPLERKALDLRDLVAEAGQSFTAQAAEAGVRLDVQLDGPLPVEADAKRLNQVLLNFLSNALKFTPAGGQVLLRADREGERAVVSVADTGAGIPQEALGTLFQPFAQAHGAEQNAKGTGLGLYICRGIAEQHGGSVRAASDGPGHGAVFTFEMPLAAPMDAKPAGMAVATGTRPR